MTSFGEYVAGRTIAIVGPAPAPYDQTAEVDAHDIVYRTSYGFRAPEDPLLLRSSSAENGQDWYQSGVFPDGYGTRVDMSFYNAGATFMAERGELDHLLADLDWAVWKANGLTVSGITNVRSCNRPPMKVPGTESQVTAMLWDLTFYEPAAVTVFGADFYTGPIETWYSPQYVPEAAILDPVDWPEHVRSILWHDQADNRRIVQMVDRLGWLAGDDRYLKALRMTPEEQQAILEEQLTRAHQASIR
jgi:hypothetical protein